MHPSSNHPMGLLLSLLRRTVRAQKPNLVGRVFSRWHVKAAARHTNHRKLSARCKTARQVFHLVLSFQRLNCLTNSKRMKRNNQKQSCCSTPSEVAQGCALPLTKRLPSAPFSLALSKSFKGCFRNSPLVTCSATSALKLRWCYGLPPP